MGSKRILNLRYVTGAIFLGNSFSFSARALSIDWIISVWPLLSASYIADKLRRSKLAIWAVVVAAAAAFICYLHWPDG